MTDVPFATVSGGASIRPLPLQVLLNPHRRGARMTPFLPRRTMVASGPSRHFAAAQQTVAFGGIVLRNSIVFVQLSWVIDLSGYALRAFCGVLDVLLPRICYAAQVTGTNGGGRQRNLTRRRRF